MIFDGTDPTGFGLFSKCARSHACKYAKKKTKTPQNQI